MAAQSTAYAMCNWQGKHTFVKENEKNEENEKKRSKSANTLRDMDESFFFTDDFSLLESCQLHIIAKYKASNCCKIEQASRFCKRGSLKNLSKFTGKLLC